MATGKAWTDVCQALDEMGLNEERLSDLGITVLKVAMPYPADEAAIRDFARDLEEILVVEEKHRLTEMNVKDALYDLPDTRRPRVVGRFNETGQMILPDWPEYTPDDIVRVLSERIAHFYTSEPIQSRLDFLQTRSERAAQRELLNIERQPFSVPAARTTPPRKCRTAVARMAASVAICWRRSWIATTPRIRIWVAREQTGSVRHRS